jgi:anti-sigma-K factor RskA
MNMGSDKAEKKRLKLEKKRLKAQAKLEKARAKAAKEKEEKTSPHPETQPEQEPEPKSKPEKKVRPSPQQVIVQVPSTAPAEKVPWYKNPEWVRALVATASLIVAMVAIVLTFY